MRLRIQDPKLRPKPTARIHAPKPRPVLSAVDGTGVGGGATFSMVTGTKELPDVDPMKTIDTSAECSPIPNPSRLTDKVISRLSPAGTTKFVGTAVNQG